MILGIIFLLAAAGAVVAGVYYWQSTKQVLTAVDLPVHKEKVDPTADWKPYSNTKYRFLLKHPANDCILETASGIFISEKCPVVESDLDGPEGYPLVGGVYLHIDEFTEPIDKSLKKTNYNGIDVYQEHVDCTSVEYPCGYSDFWYFNDPQTKYLFTFQTNDEQLLINQILATFKFTATGPTAGQGTLSGHVDIGPLCPVEQAGNPCKPTPETYQSRQATVYANDGKTVIAQKYLDAEGNFIFNLDPGNYLLTISPAGIMKDSMHKAIVTAGNTTIVNISIDTGIR